MVGIPTWDLLVVFLRVGYHPSVIEDVPKFSHLFLLISKLINVTESTLISSRTPAILEIFAHLFSWIIIFTDVLEPTIVSSLTFSHLKIPADIIDFLL